jgi:hypothetical protein
MLRLEVGEVSVQTTGVVTSGINRVPSPNAEMVGLPVPEGGYYDVRPGDPERSLLLARMGVRGTGTAMPPLGTHQVDEEGLATVTSWVQSMTEERGYPAPAP